MYIIFEGTVGSGKTTQSKKVYEYLKERFPDKTVVWTFEPGGSEIAVEIRKVVQGTNFEESMDPVCEAYLYGAARAQSLRKIVRPTLDKNGIVISDRSFITSMVFQGIGRKLGIEGILKINESAIEDILPDLVLYFDIDVKEGLKRIRKDGEERLKDDKWESESVDFFNGIKNGYNEVSKLTMFKNKWIDINAEGDVDDVFAKVIEVLEKHLKTLT